MGSEEGDEFQVQVVGWGQDDNLYAINPETLRWAHSGDRSCPIATGITETGVSM